MHVPNLIIVEKSLKLIKLKIDPLHKHIGTL